MSSNTIGIEVNVNGNIGVVASQAQNLNQNLQQAAQAANRINVPTNQGLPAGAAAALRRAGGNSGESGGVGAGNLPAGIGRGTAAGNMRGDARDFARQAQGLGGLVHLYATFAANIFAVGTAFQFLNKAMDASRMEQALTFTSLRTGVALKSLAKDMYAISDGAISMIEANKFAALGSAANIASQDMKQLSVIAKGASIGLGRDMSDSLDRLTRGVVKLEPELLDELGILTKASEAYKKYATQVGLSVNDLSSAQKSQAYLNAVLEEGTRKWADLANEMGANPYQKLLSGLKDTGTQILNLVNSIAAPIVEIISKSSTLLFALIAGITAKLVTMAIPTLTAGRNRYLGEVANLVSEQNQLMENANKIANAGVIHKQKQLNAQILIEKQSLYSQDLANIKSTYSGAYAKGGKGTKFLDTVNKASSLDDLKNSPEFVNKMKQREKDLTTEINRLEALHGPINRDKLDSLKEQETHAKSINATLSSDVNKHEKILELKRAIADLDSQKVIIQPGADYIKNEARLKAANAKDKYLSGEQGFGAMFKELQQSGSDLADNQLTKVGKSLNTIKAGATSVFMFVEKWGSQLLGLITGPWGMLATAVLAGTGPVLRWAGIFSDATDKVSEGLKRVEEQMGKTAESYAKMQGILKEAKPENWYGEFLNFNIATTTLLSESLNELTEQAKNVKALRDEANKDTGIAKWWKNRSADKAETVLQEKSVTVVEGFGANADPAKISQFLSLINKESGDTFNSISDLSDHIKNSSGQSLLQISKAATQASKDIKIMSTDATASLVTADNLTKSFDAEFSKLLSKKNYDGIAAPFRDIVSNLDVLDDKLKKLANKGPLTVGEAEKYQVLAGERARIVENLLKNEEYRAKLGKFELDTLESIVKQQKSYESSKKNQLDIEAKLSGLKKPTQAITNLRNRSIDTSGLAGGGEIDTLDLTANFDDVSDGLFDIASKMQSVKGAYLDVNKVLEDKSSTETMKVNMLRSVEAQLAALKDLSIELELIAKLKVVGGTQQEKDLVDDLVSRFKGQVDKRAQAAQAQRSAIWTTDKRRAFDKYQGPLSSDAWLAEDAARTGREAERRGRNTGKAAGGPLAATGKDKDKQESDPFKYQIGAAKHLLEISNKTIESEKSYGIYTKESGVLAAQAATKVVELERAQATFKLQQRKLSASDRAAEAAAISNKYDSELKLIELKTADSIREKRAYEDRLKSFELVKEEISLQEQKSAGVLVPTTTKLGNSFSFDRSTDSITNNLKVELPKLEKDTSSASLDLGRQTLDIEKEQYDIAIGRKTLTEEEAATRAGLLQLSIASQDAETARLNTLSQEVLVQLTMAANMQRDAALGNTDLAQREQGLAVAEQLSVLAVKNSAAISNTASQSDRLAKSMTKASNTNSMAAGLARSNKELGKTVTAFDKLGDIISDLGSLLQESFGGNFANAGKSVGILLKSLGTAATSGEKFENSLVAQKEAFEGLANTSKALDNPSLSGAERVLLGAKHIEQTNALRKLNEEVRDREIASQESKRTALYNTLSVVEEVAGRESALGKAAHAAKVGMMVYELAMQAKVAAEYVAANAEKMASDLKAMAISVAGGVARLVQQGGWAGFAAAAGFIALVAGLANKSFGGGGAGPSSDSLQPYKDDGTGTVFGDSSAKSKSLEKSLEKWNTEQLKQTQQGITMIHLLSSIDRGINGMSNYIVGTGIAKGLIGEKQFQPSTTNPWGPKVDRTIASDDVFGRKVVTGIANTLFGGKVSTSLGATGIYSRGNLTELDAGQYQITNWNKKGGWFTSGSSGSERTNVKDAELTGILKDVFGSVGDSIRESVNLITELTHDRLISMYTSINAVDLGMDLDLKDKKGSEIQELLSSAINKKSDQLTEAALKAIQIDPTTTLFDKISTFRQSGEGIFETLSKVTSQFYTARDTLAQLGISVTTAALDSLKEEDAGNIAASILKQQFIAKLAPAGKGLSDIFTLIEGSAEDIVDAYKAVDKARRSMIAVGLNQEFTQATIEAAGGIENVQAGLDALVDSGGVKAKLKLLETGAEAYLDRLRVAANNQFAIDPSSVPIKVDTAKAKVAELQGLRQNTDGSLSSGQINAIDAVIGVILSTLPQIAEYESTLKSVADTTKEELKSLADSLSNFNSSLYDIYANYMNSLGVTLDPDMINTYASSLESVNSSFEDAKTELEKSSDNLGTSLQTITSQLDSAIERIFTTLVQSINQQTVKSKLRINSLFGEDGGEEALTKVLMPAVVNAGNAINEAFVSSVDLMNLSIDDVLNGASELEQHLASQVKSGALSVDEAKRYFGLIEGAKEAKIQLIEGLKQLYDFQIDKVKQLADAIESIGELGSSWGKKIAANLDLKASNISGIKTIVAQKAYIAAELSKAQQSYQAALNAGNHERAIEAISTLGDLTEEKYQLEIDLQTELLKTTEDYYSNLRSLAKEAKNWIEDIKLSDKSPLTARSKLDEAISQFNKNLAIAKAAENSGYTNEQISEAQGKLASSASTVLDLARGFYASSPDYQNIYTTILSAMEGMTTVTVTETELRVRTNTLIDAQNLELQGLQNQLGNLKTSLETTLNASIISLQGTMSTLLTQGIGISDLVTALNNLPSAIASAVSNITVTTTGSAATTVTPPAATTVTPPAATTVTPPAATTVTPTATDYAVFAQGNSELLSIFNAWADLNPTTYLDPNGYRSVMIEAKDSAGNYIYDDTVRANFSAADIYNGSGNLSPDGIISMSDLGHYAWNNSMGDVASSGSAVNSLGYSPGEYWTKVSEAIAALMDAVNSVAAAVVSTSNTAIAAATSNTAAIVDSNTSTEGTIPATMWYT